MNKEAYLNELLQYLKQLSPAERKDILADYMEHFEQAELSGRTEEEVILKLGEPKLVAREVLAQSQIQKAGQSPSLPNVTKAVMAMVSLGLFNLIIVFLPFVASLLVLAGLYGFSLFLVISPILLIIQHQSVSILIHDFFLMLGLVGAGLLLMVGALKVTGLYYKLVIRYLLYNLKAIGRI
ncbi:DUF1700 domain-containing protein [Paenibacillus woosongensis]|uniref:DUF1700 domain-containing protein n=1 Tax=Paenibacillus woosongensis TaxID=307580 RepID=A0AA95I2W5_9BACL|nr:DUF1700 domain-containing protein [Paenibacillus woosongensis]WHX49559.1 DUF1700 domain-containing protein [Paenibacillus woosongensis]